MEHKEAVSIGATERYLLGELGDDERDAFEEHYFSCTECAADVRAASQFVEGAAHVLSNGAGAKGALLAAPGGSAPERERKPRRLPHRGLAWFFPMPLGAAATLAAAVGLLAWQSLVALPATRDELARATRPQPASWAFLSVSRAEPQTVTVARAEGWLGLTLSRSSSTEAYPYYRCRLSRAGEASIDWTVPAPEPGGELQAALRLERMSAGRYELALDGLRGPDGPVGAASVARYEFSLRYRGE